MGHVGYCTTYPSSCWCNPKTCMIDQTAEFYTPFCHALSDSYNPTSQDAILYNIFDSGSGVLKNFGLDFFTATGTDYGCNTGSNYKLYRKVYGANDNTYVNVCDSDPYGATTCNFNPNKIEYSLETSNGALAGWHTLKLEMGTVSTTFWGRFCYWANFPA